MRTVFPTFILILFNSGLFSQTISISSIVPATICAGSNVNVTFTTTGTFSNGNNFIIQLSNANGVFTSPIILNTIAATTGGTHACTIPANQSSGNGYRIRIVSTNPTLTSSPNANDLSIVSNPLPGITPKANPASVCAGESSILTSGVASTKFSVDPIPFQKIAVPANAQTGPTGDDVNSSPINLPFSFNFYGPSYNQFVISTNGNIQFGPTYYTTYTTVSFPTTNVRNFIALCWADIVVGSHGNTRGKIKYFVDGTAPNRKLIVDYDSCAFYTGSTSSTGFFAGQIWLFETSNIIELHLFKSQGLACCATSANSFKTLGVLNANGTIGEAAPNRNGTAWQTTVPEAWRFTPPGNYNYAWTPVNNLNVANKDTVIATPPATTVYNVVATNIFTGCIATGSTTVTVNPIVTPDVSVAVTSGTNPSCSGNTITFTATPVFGGTVPAYQWQKNGVTINGATLNTYSSSSISNNDQIRCILTSNAACLSRTRDTSNSILCIITPGVVPFISVSASPTGTITPGTTVTFTANYTNGGSNPQFQWKKNGLNVGTNSAVYSDNSWQNGNSITCTLTSNQACANPASVTSNTISLVVPIVLLNFEVKRVNAFLSCIWQTASEFNTSHFVLQKSTNGTDFIDIGNIAAAGNSSYARYYSFTDTRPAAGNNFYRLKQVDKDGKFEYSPIQKAVFVQNETIVLYPNPVKNTFSLSSSTSVKQVHILDGSGKRVLQFEANTNNLFNVSKLSKGTYIALITLQNNVEQVLKFTKL